MAFTQDKRIAVCRSPLGEDKLFLTELQAREEISRPYSYQMHLVSEEPGIDFTKIVGKPISVEVMYNEGNPRFFHGIVSRFAQGGQDDRFTHYRAEVVPQLWLLSQRRNCRIFQEKSVSEILRKILEEHKVTNVDYRFKPADYLPWTYCVQYRESDLEFVSRLLEEEGIFYYFLHEKDRHVLVFGDLPNHHDDCGQAQFRMRPRKGGSPHISWMDEWTKTQEIRAGKYALTDYNFLDPSTKLLVNSNSTIEIGDNGKLEDFDYPGDFVNVGPESDGKIEKGERWVKVRMQEAAAASITFNGSSSARDLVPGTKFELKEHTNDAFNGKYLVRGVTHKLEQSGDIAAGLGGKSSYQNEVDCIPFAIPFRPRRVTPRPVVRGPQTAVVVGPEEIQIDEHARVKVLFHWDREGTKDGNSSCWIRVAEHWAGKGWGSQFHPRVGQEVVVDFLEGNPNQPIITGRVYNAEQTVHLPSPTQSGFMTRSSSDGGPDDFNQLRFEDEKGSEEIYLHAQKDWVVEVENDERKHVTRHRSETVDKNVTIEIGGDRSETVEGNRSLTVEGNKTEAVTGTKTVGVKQDHTEDIKGAMKLTIKKDRTMSVTGKLTEEVGEDMSTTVAKTLKVTVTQAETHTCKDSRTVNVTKTNKMVAKEGYKLEAKAVAIEAKEEIVLKTGSASITMKSGGDIVIKGKNIEFSAESDIKMKGSKIGQN